MKNFCLERYTFSSEKIKRETGPVRFHVISDLHGNCFGQENELLLERIRRRRPDVILIPGDLIVGFREGTFSPAFQLLRELVKDYPVIYAPGNHETKMEKKAKGQQLIADFERDIRRLGVTYLRNQKSYLGIRGSSFLFHGLELEPVYYKKPVSPMLTKEHMSELVGRPWEKGYHILLAHSPKYGETYFQWGADLTVSGHYHGGVLRLGRHLGVISPQYELFPSYCCGDFRQGDKRMVVSAGMGDHSMPIRIHNPKVLVEINLLPLEKKPISP